MDTPPPPILPPASSTPPQKSGSRKVLFILLGCGGLLLLTFVAMAAVGLWWYFSSRSEGKSGSSASTSGAQGLGVGATLSQYQKAAGSACIIGPDGTWHAVFQEMSNYGQPLFIYHRASRDGGRTWSPAVPISEDGTGNGAGYPQMGKDHLGNVYAAWIRFGKGGHVVTSATLDGPGGYTEGTVTLRRWNGSGWDAPLTVGTPESVTSFYLFNAADGSLQVVWNEPLGMIAQCPVAGGNGVQLVAAGELPSDNPTWSRPGNLAAVPDGKGGTIVLAEIKADNMQQLIYIADGQYYSLANDPKSQTRNTFNFPSRMFVDSAGKVHVLYIPYPLGSATSQLWDIDPSTRQHTVVFSGITGTGKETIQNFQFVASNDGTAHVTVQFSDEAAYTADTTDIAAISFDGSRWSAPRVLTGNARGESFAHKEMPGGNVAVLDKYYAKHASLALDAKGKVRALATIDNRSIFSSGSYEKHGGRDYNVTFGGSVSQPSVYVLPWE